MSPLGLGDAVAAIIEVDGSRYLFQKRDDRDGIWYPDHWGVFGGAIDAGESAEMALRRELWEELRFSVAHSRTFIDMAFDMDATGLGQYRRRYFHIAMSEGEASRLELGEGKAMALFDERQILDQIDLVPYDAFVLFLFLRRARLRDPERK